MQCVIKEDAKWSKEIKRCKRVGFFPNQGLSSNKKIKKKCIISNDTEFKIISNFISHLGGIV